AARSATRRAPSSRSGPCMRSTDRGTRVQRPEAILPSVVREGISVRNSRWSFRESVPVVQYLEASRVEDSGVDSSRWHAINLPEWPRGFRLAGASARILFFAVALTTLNAAPPA